MTTEKPMKGMFVEVLRGCYEAANRGVTDSLNHFSEVLLVGDGVPEIFEAKGRPILKLVRRNLHDGEYLHAEPIEDVPEGHVGWTSGGNFIWSSDSRFPNNYPISVHDRSDTVEDFALLSM